MILLTRLLHLDRKEVENAMKNIPPPFKGLKTWKKPATPH